MESIKRVFLAHLSALKAFAARLHGKNEKLAKIFPVIAALLFVASCAVKSLHALSVAEREAAQRHK